LDTRLTLKDKEISKEEGNSYQKSKGKTLLIL